MAQYNSYDMCEILFMWITVETLQLIRDTQYINIYIGYANGYYLISNYNVLTLLSIHDYYEQIILQVAIHLSL